MSMHVEVTPGGAAMVEVRDGRGRLIVEGHVLAPDGHRSSRIALGDQTLSPGVLRDLIEAELALLANAERLDRRHT